MDSWVAFIIGMLTVITAYVIFWCVAIVNDNVRTAYEIAFCEPVLVSNDKK